MTRFDHIATFGSTFSGRSHMFDDLEWGFDGDKLLLHGASRSGNAMVAWSMEDGGTNYRDWQELPSGGLILGGLEMLKIQIDGVDHLSALAGGSAGVASYEIGAVGRINQPPVQLQGEGLDSAISTAEAFTVGAQEMLYSVKIGTGRIQIAEVGNGGALVDRGSVILPNASDISDLETVQVGSSLIMLATSAWTDRVYSLSVTSDGGLRQGSSWGALEGLGIDAPTAIKTFVKDGQAFAVVGGSGSSSLSVLSIADDGGLAPVQHLVDDLNTRFQNVTALDVVEADGRVFVAAGGGDDGLTVFEALAGGTLTLLGSVEDTFDTTLQNVSALALGVTEGTLHIAVSSATEAGVSRFTMDLPAQSVRIDDTAGNDTVRAGAGDDIIFGGLGADDISGGEGYDVFVMAADDQVDVIRDFEVGIDKIDLSGWEGLRGIDQLRLAITGNGGRIFYEDTILNIFPNPRGPLTHQEIVEALSPSFQATATGNVFAEGVQEGSGADDMIEGVQTADDLSGNGGNDQIMGFDGNDTLRGGDGDDSLDGGLMNDVLLGDAGNDTLLGQAGDDTLNGGEGADFLVGGQGSDTIIVDNAGDNVGESRNWEGHDLIVAYVSFRMGRDHVEDMHLRGDAIVGAGNGLMNEIRGTSGDNILDGGKNNDTLVGGAGNDTYLVRAPGDLVVEAKGSGDADVVKAFRAYALTDNVERLYLQTLRDKDGEGIAGINGIGNTLDNLIVGNPFDNVIVGREGRDTLKGQAGSDTFVFDRALGANNIDRIIDFNTNEANEGDSLKIKLSALAGSGLKAGELAAGHMAYGTAARDGNDRFVFDQASGRLWFDVDGAGGQSQQLMATFDQDASLSASDIILF